MTFQHYVFRQRHTINKIDRRSYSLRIFFLTMVECKIVECVHILNERYVKRNERFLSLLCAYTVSIVYNTLIYKIIMLLKWFLCYNMILKYSLRLKIGE